MNIAVSGAKPLLLSDFVGGTFSSRLAMTSALDLIRSSDGGLIGRIAESGADGVDRAVKVASTAFAANRKQAAHRRIAWLKAAAAWP